MSDRYAGHTPGPWKWLGDELWHIGEAYKPHPDPHMWVAVMGTSQLTSADKLLIADAPKLLAQRERLLEIMRTIQELAEHDIGDPEGTALYGIEAEACAAIKECEG